MKQKNTKESTLKFLTKEFTGAVFRMPRFAPSWFVFSFVPLLYIRNLGQNWYQIFVPAIVVYGIGTVLIGTLHRLIAIVYEGPIEVVEEGDEEEGAKKHIYIPSNNEVTIPFLGRLVLYTVHLVWFALFIWYLIHGSIIKI